MYGACFEWQPCKTDDKTNKCGAEPVGAEGPKVETAVGRSALGLRRRAVDGYTVVQFECLGSQGSQVVYVYCTVGQAGGPVVGLEKLGRHCGWKRPRQPMTR